MTWYHPALAQGAFRESDDEIKQLKAKVERLRAALEKIANRYERGGCLGRDADEMIDIARDALNQ